MRIFPLLALALAAATTATAVATATAQQPLGSVATTDAKLSGDLQLHGSRAVLLSNDSITALDHTATITLARGGEALVCATSQFHLLHSGAGPALLFGLDRGAIEIHGATQPQDVLLTPDIRFSVEHAGTLNLALRVTPDGDTCVDNAGPGAPVLILNASFTGASYRLLPGQHVLFEHGDLRSVVDNERSACGCPSTTTPTAEQLATMTPAQRAFPFPSAASAGLTASSESSPTVPPNAAGITANPSANAAPIPIAAEPESAPTTAQQSHGFFHALGSFFKRLFS